MSYFLWVLEEQEERYCFFGAIWTAELGLVSVSILWFVTSYLFNPAALTCVKNLWVAG